MTARRVASLAAVAVAVSIACGETRRSIGEECLRDDDCLSAVCAFRACMPAPPLIGGVTEPPPDELPRIPDASLDASTGAEQDARADGS